MSHVKNLMDQKFGRLTVLKYSHTDKYKKANWLCQCDCGNKKIIPASSLIEGKTKSCGCYRKEIRQLQRGEAAFNATYQHYMYQARKRNLIFLLSKEQFLSLTKQECYYCGSKPNNESGRFRNGSFIYNGIDRIDNNHGYELDNCVSCCQFCNRAKNTLSQTEFFQQITKIANKHIILEQEKIYD